MNAAPQVTPQVADESRAFPTPTELRVLRVAIMGVCLTVIVLLVALVLWGLAVVMSLFKPLLLPLAVAGVLALVLHPATDTLHREVDLVPQNEPPLNLTQWAEDPHRPHRQSRPSAPRA